jgi:hypothetical protein
MIMSTMNLKELIQFASAQAETIFRRNGELLPMWHAIKADGEQLIVPSPPCDDKDVSVGLIKALFELENVETYVFMSEAWMLRTTTDGVPRGNDSLEHHPDRREAIMFAAENRDGEEQTACRFILRPENGKAKLSPLKMDDMKNRTSEGRMVGLLRRRKQ